MVLKEVKVPNLVKNGTREHVILDCVYSLNHSEKDGMILKWYFNGKTIFQWIPPSKPKVCYSYLCRKCRNVLFFFFCMWKKKAKLDLYAKH